MDTRSNIDKFNIDNASLDRSVTSMKSYQTDRCTCILHRQARVDKITTTFDLAVTDHIYFWSIFSVLAAPCSLNGSPSHYADRKIDCRHTVNTLVVSSILFLSKSRLPTKFIAVNFLCFTLK